jgi:hypothetical protein
MVAQLVECTAETTGRLKASETQHRVVALFDRSMTLLHTVVQVLILAMQHLATDDPANCLRVGRMFVSRHPQKFLFFCQSLTGSSYFHLLPFCCWTVQHPPLFSIAA